MDDLADQFVRVRLIKITEVDLNLFEFDYDLTWAAFFMNTSNKIYGRFGGRDPKGADTRNTLEGLHYAMTAALAEHRKDPIARPDQPARQPVYVESFPAAKQYRGCIHCHQVKEILRQEEITAGTWLKEKIYTYPLPENVGITLDKQRGNLVNEVKPRSTAAKIGLKPGDLLKTVNRNPVRSFADATYGLHKAPLQGETAITWQRDGKTMQGTLTLEPGWRRTNVTWRRGIL